LGCLLYLKLPTPTLIIKYLLLPVPLLATCYGPLDYSLQHTRALARIRLTYMHTRNPHFAYLGVPSQHPLSRPPLPPHGSRAVPAVTHSRIKFLSSLGTSLGHSNLSSSTTILPFETYITSQPTFPTASAISLRLLVPAVFRGPHSRSRSYPLLHSTISRSIILGVPLPFVYPKKTVSTFAAAAITCNAHPQP
jgi:hypothetical protein